VAAYVDRTKGGETELAKPQSDFKGLDKSVRKQRIIDAATTIFHQKGYHQATLDDVARALGLTKPALYHYFSSKEAILSVIYMQAMENYFAEYADAGQLEGLDLTPPEKLRFFIRNHLQRVAIDNLAMLGVFLTEENQLPEKDLKQIRKEKRRYNLVVEGIIKEGQAGGLFKPGNARLTANAILGMCNSLYRWYRPDKDGPGADETIDLFVSLLEDGYLVKERLSSDMGQTDSEAGDRKTLKRDLQAEQKRHSEALSRLIHRL
jgi:AcrR family transcriptional regulator